MRVAFLLRIPVVKQIECVQAGSVIGFDYDLHVITALFKISLYSAPVLPQAISPAKGLDSILVINAFDLRATSKVAQIRLIVGH